MIISKTVCDICKAEHDLGVFRFEISAKFQFSEVQGYKEVHLCQACQEIILLRIYQERSAQEAHMEYKLLTGSSDS